jgi:anti-anti-sigma factor
LRHNTAVWRITLVDEVAGDVSIVTASGRLSAATASQWRNVLERVVGDRKILLDLGGVDYACSAAVVTLRAFLDRREGQNGRVVVCGLGDAVRLTFDLAGLLAPLTVAATRASALALLNDPGDSS